MAGNVALDIVIGLVFIYLLYSLYATVLMELIASFLSLRAQNLRYALRRMLTEETTYKNSPFTRFFVQLLSTFSRITGAAINQQNPDLLDKFFEQPTIKYLSSGGLGSTPSYISAENFTKALIDTIKIDNLEAGTLVAIEKGLIESELLKLKPNTQKHLLSLLSDANNDLEKFRILVEKWYNDTMERATGWYKQTTQSLLIIIGFFLAFSFNVDTLSIVQKLSKDDEARNNLVSLAVEFSERNRSVSANPLSPVDSANAKEALESLKATKKSLEDDIKNTQNILSSAWNIPASIPYYKNGVSPDSIKKGYIKTTLVYKGKEVVSIIPQSLDITALKASVNTSCSLTPDSTLTEMKTDKKVEPKPEGVFEINSFKYKWEYFWGHFWGYILTVLALSLGAPFWFDLLNKLVKLRSSKALSGDETGGKTATIDKNATLTRAG